jgi:hypothetical protein
MATLMGTAGSGKIRLALEAATSHLGASPDGVGWSKTAAVRSPEHVPKSYKPKLS